MAPPRYRKISVKLDFILGRSSRHPPTITLRIRTVPQAAFNDELRTSRSRAVIEDIPRRHSGTVINISSSSDRIFSSMKGDIFPIDVR
jgi:hypothetical protein